LSACSFKRPGFYLKEITGLNLLRNQFLKKGEGEMNKTIKILHIDPDFRVTYFINHEGVLISSPISQEQAIALIKNGNLDLILSEPHHKAILTPQGHSRQMDLNFYDNQLNFKKEGFSNEQFKKL
jgi:hypothetical protein